ncbi:MAG: UDP-glucose 4-epimerase [Planctomycetota bacterium]|jgi:UDP-glucose 4-epimerase
MITQPEKKTFENKSIVVLGASGFIGRWIAKTLSQYDIKLTLLVRDPQSFDEIARRWHLKGEIVAFDALEPGKLAKLLGQYSPDIVINCIGYGIDRSEKDENLAAQLNGIFPKRLAEILGERSSTTPTRLIHLGSALEYGQQDGDLLESCVAKPTSLYGRTKLLGTEAVRVAVSQGLDATVARLFTIYGPGEHCGRLLPTLRQAKEAGQSVDLSDGGQLRDFALVKNVAQAVVALAALPELKYDVLNLASGALVSVREFILTAANILQLSSDHLNFGVVPRYADEMQHRPVSTERCRKLLGDSLSTDLERGLTAALRFEESGE